MDKYVIFPQENDILGMLIPCVQSGLTIEEIARKDVPAGVPYLIINREDLPEDIVFSDAWEADFSNPHGYGIGHEAWFAEQENK